MNFMISTAALLAASHCLSKEETRYYLTGVYVAPHPEKGCILVGTDGHRMMVVHDDHGRTPRSCILLTNWKHKGLKKSAKETGSRCLAMDLGETAKLNVAQVRRLVSPTDDGGYDEGELVDSLTVNEIDGTFPDWTRVVPFKTLGRKLLPEMALAFNVSLLADFATAFGEFGHTSKDVLNLSADGTGEPILITNAYVHNAFGILMPVRPEAGKTFYFMNPWAPAQKQEAA